MTCCIYQLHTMYALQCSSIVRSAASSNSPTAGVQQCCGAFCATRGARGVLGAQAPDQESEWFILLHSVNFSFKMGFTRRNRVSTCQCPYSARPRPLPGRNDSWGNGLCSSKWCTNSTEAQMVFFFFGTLNWAAAAARHKRIRRVHLTC